MREEGKIKALEEEVAKLKRDVEFLKYQVKSLMYKQMGDDD